MSRGFRDMGGYNRAARGSENFSQHSFIDNPRKTPRLEHRETWGTRNLAQLKAVQPLPLYRFFTSILRGSYLDVKPYWYWYWRPRMASRIACFDIFTLHLTLGTTGVAI